MKNHQNKGEFGEFWAFLLASTPLIFFLVKVQQTISSIPRFQWKKKRNEIQPVFTYPNNIRGIVTIKDAYIRLCLMWSLVYCTIIIIIVSNCWHTALLAWCFELWMEFMNNKTTWAYSVLGPCIFAYYLFKFCHIYNVIKWCLCSQRGNIMYQKNEMQCIGQHANNNIVSCHHSKLWMCMFVRSNAFVLAHRGYFMVSFTLYLALTSGFCCCYYSCQSCSSSAIRSPSPEPVKKGTCERTQCTLLSYTYYAKCTSKTQPTISDYYFFLSSCVVI